ncbi:MAG: trigger factor [Oscillospiraceae bacterium]|nr:trigger factor [Oscillospiraceae bacterium]
MEFTYKGLTAQLQKHTVTDEEVDRQMQRLLQQTPRFTEITGRPTQNGDEIVLDYAGFCDGEQFAGGTAENQTLVLGSGTFIPGFEEQLIGKNVGDKVTVEVTFPEQYHSDALAGKPAQFHCTIHGIRIRSAYELDDTFAQEVGGCETLEAFNLKLRRSMQAFADQQGEMELQDNLLRQAAETLDFTPDEASVEAELDAQMQTMRAQLARQGATLEMYCQFMATDEKTLREEGRATAVQNLRNKAAIDKIVELEKLVPTQEEITQMLTAICRQNSLTMEQLRDCYDQQLEDAVTQSVLMSKVLELIRKNATVTTV